MNTAEKIKYYREAAGLTQKEVADKLGVNPQAVWKYEKGIVTNIPIRNLEIMAEMFGITPDKLTNWDKEDESPEIDEDLMALREQLRRSPETRMLFDVTKHATPEQIKLVAEMLKQWKSTSD